MVFQSSDGTVLTFQNYSRPTQTPTQKLKIEFYQRIIKRISTTNYHYCRPPIALVKYSEPDWTQLFAVRGLQTGGKSGQKQVLKCSWREMFVSKLFWFDKNTYKEHVYFRDTSRDRKTINFGQELVNKEIWDPNRRNRNDGVFVTSHSSDLTDCRWMEHFSISNIPHQSIIQTYGQDFKWYFQQRA